MGKKAHKRIGEWVVHSLIKRGEFWHGRARHDTGVVRWYSTRESNKRLAEEKVLNWAKDLGSPATGEGIKRVLVKDAFHEFFELRRSLKKNTIAKYKVFEKFLNEQWGERFVDEITLKDAEYLFKKMDEKGLHEGSQRNYLWKLRGLFRWCMRHGHTKIEPTDGIKIKLKLQVTPVALTYEQARLLIQKCVEPSIIDVKDRGREFKCRYNPPSWLQLAVLVALHTGMRKSNILHLRIEQINLAESKITIPKEEMKNGAELALPVHPELKVALEEHLKKINSTSGFILKKGGVNEMRSFYSAVKRAGLPHMRFHDLRHTVSTWLAVRFPQAIKDAMLGHAPRGVSGLYTHVPFEELKKAIDAMPRLLTSDEPAKHDQSLSSEI